MAYLEVETQEGIQRIPLDQPHVTIGRLSSNDVVLPYQQISRYHAELRQIGEAWWIADLQSTNGLRVRGERIERRALRPGERVFLAPGIAVRLMVPDDSADLSIMPTTHMAIAAPSSPAGDVSRPGFAGDAALPMQLPPLELHSQSVASGSVPGSATDPPTTPGDEPPPAWLPSAHASAWTSRPRVTGSPASESSTPWAFVAPAEDGALEGDLFRRRRARVGGGTTGTPAPVMEAGTPPPAAAMLHLCQTCGQLTAPDVVHCQSCRSSIARPCHACDLPLLPIQDRCPRCQTPNAASVLRARRGVLDG